MNKIKPLWGWAAIFCSWGQKFYKGDIKWAQNTDYRPGDLWHFVTSLFSCHTPSLVKSLKFCPSPAITYDASLMFILSSSAQVLVADPPVSTGINTKEELSTFVKSMIPYSFTAKLYLLININTPIWWLQKSGKVTVNVTVISTWFSPPCNDGGVVANKLNL